MRGLRLLLVLCLTIWAGLAPAQEPTFESGPLNTGLGPVPDAVDRSTPRATVESFLSLAADGNWDAAAHLLDLTGIPPEDQPQQGPALARDLATVLERKVVIDWQDLPDRPDAGLETAMEAPAAQGSPRRSLRLWIVELENRPVPIRLNRLAPPEGEPVWLFAGQTVGNLPALVRLYGPSPLERALPEALRETAFAGLMRWELIALPVLLLLIAGIAWGAHRLGSALARRMRGRGGQVAAAVRGPLTLLLVVVATSVLVGRIFVFSGRIDAILSPVLALGLTGAIMWLVVATADTLIDRMTDFDHARLSQIGDGQEERRHRATAIGAARRLGLVVIALVGLGMVLNEANALRSLGISLLASAGALTLILAFAARNVLANIMASLQIALNRSAEVGDKILFDGRICVVERIHFTYVQLRVWTGERLVVPVEDFVGEVFENWTMQDPDLVRRIEIRLHHAADAGILRQPLQDALGEIEEGLGPRDAAAVYVTGHDVFGQTVLCTVPCTDPNTAWGIECRVRESLLAAAARMEREEGRPVFPEATPAESA